MGNLVKLHKRWQLQESTVYKGKRGVQASAQKEGGLKELKKKKNEGRKMWQANMHKHTPAIITDTWHNTSKLVNITPRI